jgi:hypothetical protein
MFVIGGMILILVLRRKLSFTVVPAKAGIHQTELASIPSVQLV